MGVGGGTHSPVNRSSKLNVFSLGISMSVPKLLVTSSWAVSPQSSVEQSVWITFKVLVLSEAGRCLLPAMGDTASRACRILQLKATRRLVLAFNYSARNNLTVERLRLDGSHLIFALYFPKLSSTHFTR